MTTTLAIPSPAAALSLYWRTLTGLLGHPRRFFGDLPEALDLRQSAGFLGLSAILHATLALIFARPANTLTVGGTLLLNAVGMVGLLSVLGYLLSSVSGRPRVRFGRLFQIYALSSGVVLLVSWLPAALVYTEIWKWWLIGTGMTTGLGFRWYRALAIIGASVMTTILLFYWLLSTGMPS